MNGRKIKNSSKEKDSDAERVTLRHSIPNTDKPQEKRSYAKGVTQDTVYLMRTNPKRNTVTSRALHGDTAYLSR